MAECRAACREGWCLFDSHGLYAIQRDDERNLFANDEAALRHVKRQAALGIAHAVRALALRGTPA